MKIFKNIYKNILDEMNPAPPEMGGIIGGINDCVTHFYVDKRITANKYCSYSPDVCKFNELIQSWQEKSITFMGVFHSHFYDVSTLSKADLEYIEKIMCAMPETVEYLYFPIVVFPQREMVIYKAKIVDTRLCITKENIIKEEQKNEE